MTRSAAYGAVFASRVAAPFAVEVASAGFLASARRWISSALDSAGIRATGPSEQVRVRPWSTQLVTPTAEGRVWFKANCTGLTHEAALHAELARIGGGFVDPPLAVHMGNGWLLTCDRGPTLAERGEVTLDQWCALVQEAARLQRHVADLPIVRAIGVVDCSPVTVLPRFEALLDRFA